MYPNDDLFVRLQVTCLAIHSNAVFWLHITLNHRPHFNLGDVYRRIFGYWFSPHRFKYSPEPKIQSEGFSEGLRDSLGESFPNANPKDSFGRASLSQRDPFGVGRSQGLLWRMPYGMGPWKGVPWTFGLANAGTGFEHSERFASDLILKPK